MRSGVYTTGDHSIQWVGECRTGSDSDRLSIGRVIQVPILCFAAGLVNSGSNEMYGLA